MAPIDDNSVPGINVAGKNGAAFPVIGNAATGAILVASAGRGTGAISNAPKDANHVSGLVAKDKATGKAFAVQGNQDTGAIFVQDLNGGGGGGAATWGSITGDISDNAELTAELNKKANKVGDTFTGDIAISKESPSLSLAAKNANTYTIAANTIGRLSVNNTTKSTTPIVIEGDSPNEAIKVGSGTIKAKRTISVESDIGVLGFRQIRGATDISFGIGGGNEFLVWNNKTNKNVIRLAPDLSYVKIGEVAHLYGTGQPNGVVSASPGSTYTDTAVTCGAVKWIKVWGMSNTGWTVLYGDTGWRDIKALLDPFWDSTSNIQLRRIGRTVYLRSNGLKVGDNPTGARSALKTLFPGKDDMPLGFRNAGWGTCHAAVNIGGTQLGAIYSSRGAHDFSIRAVPGAGNWTKGDLCSFNMSYVTENDWPTVLPGGGE